MKCFSPLKGWKNLDTGGIVFRRSSIAGDPMEVRCGQCLGCRLHYRQEWAIRISHEASLYDHNCFVTLTYDEEFLPPGGSLLKSDFQKFMKRLRKRFRGTRVRYYYCGEYGEANDGELGRPHFHACLFNFDLPDKQVFRQNDSYPLFVSEILQQLWPYGFSTVGALNFDSAAYCSGYILKKVKGHRAPDHYERVDTETGEVYWLLPEYVNMSTRPGIAHDWFRQRKDDVYPFDEVPVRGKGVLKGTPRYYDKLLEASDPHLLERVQLDRQRFRDSHLDSYSTRMLENEFKIRKAALAEKERRRLTCRSAPTLQERLR